jgi:hypothetical protein
MKTFRRVWVYARAYPLFGVATLRRGHRQHAGRVCFPKATGLVIDQRHRRITPGLLPPIILLVAALPVSRRCSTPCASASTTPSSKKSSSICAAISTPRCSACRSAGTTSAPPATSSPASSTTSPHGAGAHRRRRAGRRRVAPDHRRRRLSLLCSIRGWRRGCFCPCRFFSRAPSGTPPRPASATGTSAGPPRP